MATAAMPLQDDFDLQAAQIQELTDRDAIMRLFALLGYDTNMRLTQTAEAMRFPEGLKRDTRHIERVAGFDDGALPLEVYLAELKSVTVANVQALARSQRNAAARFLWVLTSDYERIDFVLLEPTLPDAQAGGPLAFRSAYLRPRVLMVNRRNPGLVALRVLRRCSFTEPDADYQFEKLQSAFTIAEWSEPFFNNRALFSDYYLTERLRESAEWRESPVAVLRSFRELFSDLRPRVSGKGGAVVRTELLEPALRALGFTLRLGLPAMDAGPEAGPGDFSLFVDAAEQPIACVMTYAWDRNLDGREDEQQSRDDETAERNPGAFVVSLLEQAGAPAWAIVTNGKIWRLYAARAHSRATNYYEIDLEETIASPDPQLAFRYFWLFFRARAFVPDPRRNGRSFLDEIFEDSAQFAKKLGERLKDRVFEQIFPYFAEGFIHAIREREGQAADLGPARLDTIFRGTLTFLYRLLFLLYAEARDLLPLRNAHDYRTISLTALKEEIARRAGTILDEVPAKLAAYSLQATDLYDWLGQLFAVVDRGDPDRNVPLYNGGLFMTQPNDDDRTPEAESARFLAAHKIPDRFLALGLDRMARDIDPKRGDLVFIDYKSLGVRQFGSIYEGLLEFKLRIADTAMAVVRGKKTEEIVPYAEAKREKRNILKRGRGRNAAEWVIETGTVYLENDKRERKATGSYYTPDYIVQYIVRQTVEPVLAAKCEALLPRIRAAQQRFRDAVQRKRVIEKMAPNEPALLNDIAGAVLADLFSLRVCDPAMGSGHFLVEAVDYITDYLVRFMERFPFLSQFFAGMRQTILAEMEQQGVIIDPARLSDVNLLKRHVLKRCVYGVDKNPMAVELAKVSLWLDCFTIGAPLSFLDHHLKCGNSLIGARVLEVQEAVTYGQLSLFGDSQFAGVMLATDLMRQVGELEDVTAEQLRQSRAEFQRASEALAPYKRILDVYTSRWFGNQPSKAQAKSGLLPTIDFLRDAQARDWLEDPQRGVARLPAERHTLAATALRAAEEQQFFHWELEFPEVFFSRDAQQETAIPGLKADGGFDVVIGNPPYDVLSEKERLEDLGDLTSYIEDQEVYAPSLGRKMDFFRLFVVKGINLVKHRGRLGQILPMSILADQQTERLRKYLLEVHCLRVINAFPQKDDESRRVFAEAKLPTCIIILEVNNKKLSNLRNKAIAEVKSERSDDFAVVIHPGKLLEEIAGEYHANSRQIELFNKESASIPLVTSNIAFKLAVKLASANHLQPFGRLLRTYQGEINETSMAHLLTTNSADGPKLLRGSNVQRYEFFEDAKQGDDKYIKVNLYIQEVKGEKSFHPNLTRIGYQRNAALDTWKRLIFTPIPKPSYCFDSVSYFLIENSTSWFYLALLNSALAEWRFRLTSTNNHVSTDEIASLPLRRILFTTPAAERVTRLERLIAHYAAGEDAALLIEVERCLPHDAAGNFLAFLPGATGREEQSDVVHDLLAHLAEQMIALNQAKQTEQRRFLSWLEDELRIGTDRAGNSGLDALTGKSRLRNYLGDYHKDEEALSFAELEDILFKNRSRLGVSLGAGLISRLRDEYERSIEVLRPLKAQLARTDWLIDQIVYRLYGLSEEEIAVVEGGKQREPPRSAASPAQRVALAQTTDAELLRATLQELEHGAANLIELAARVAERNPLNSPPRSLVEDIVRELQAIGWASVLEGRLTLGAAVPRSLLRNATSAAELHCELAVAHELQNGVVSMLLNRLRALGPHRQGALVLPEPELNPPAERAQLADYARRQAAEWAAKLRQEYPATAAYLDDQRLGDNLATQFVELATLPSAVRRASRASELIRDAFASALFGDIAAPRELIYAWVPRLAQAGLLMWARQLFGVSGMAIFPVGKFRSPDDPVDQAGIWQPGNNYRRVTVAAGEVALQAYALHTPHDEAGLERFIQVLVAEYQALRSQERQPYVALLACRDRVCYRLQIGNPIFEQLLGKAVVRGAARQIPYSIAVEPDQSWAERGSNALELPVMFNGPRYLLAIEEHN